MIKPQNVKKLSQRNRVRKTLEEFMAPLKLKPKALSQAVNAILNTLDGVVIRKEFFTGRNIADGVELVICRHSRLDWLNRSLLSQNRISICKTIAHWNDKTFDWDIFVLIPVSGGGY